MTSHIYLKIITIWIKFYVTKIVIPFVISARVTSFVVGPLEENRKLNLFPKNHVITAILFNQFLLFLFYQKILK